MFCRSTLRLVIAGLVFLALFQNLPAEEDPRVVVRPAFGEDCETMVIKEASLAKKEILVAIFSLTRRNINAALVKAVKRGVQVIVKYDARQGGLESMNDAITYLKKQGVHCRAVTMADEHAAMHHKFMVVDRKRVLTGSYNYTVPATIINYENLVVIESPETAEAFAKEFERIKDR